MNEATVSARTATDEHVLTARLTWLESAGDDNEARAIEDALLVESENGQHDGDPQEDHDDHR